MRPVPLVKFTTHSQHADGNRHKIQNYEQGKIEAVHIDSIRESGAATRTCLLPNARS
jgi:hypothetical protein